MKRPCPLELAELLDSLASPGKHAQNVESDLVTISVHIDGERVDVAFAVRTYRLAQRPALADSDLITLLNTESRGNMGGKVLVTLLVTVVLGDEVKIFSPDDKGTVHLGRHDGSGQDTATDRDEAGEGALLVCSHHIVSTCIPLL
jgi:hypothetical protein